MEERIKELEQRVDILYTIPVNLWNSQSVFSNITPSIDLFTEI